MSALGSAEREQLRLAISARRRALLNDEAPSRMSPGMTARVLELRSSGFSYRRIGRELGISMSFARKIHRRSGASQPERIIASNGMSYPSSRPNGVQRRRLTDRQQQIIVFLDQGMSRAEIAATLGIRLRVEEWQVMLKHHRAQLAITGRDVSMKAARPHEPREAAA